jgi:hypothetical protein
LTTTIEEIRGGHTLLAGELKLHELKQFTIETCDIKGLALDKKTTRRKSGHTTGLRRLEDLQHRLLTI